MTPYKVLQRTNKSQKRLLYSAAAHPSGLRARPTPAKREDHISEDGKAWASRYVPQPVKKRGVAL